MNSPEQKPNDPPEREKNVAFGGFVKPEMYDVFGEYDLSSLTDAEKEWMNPEQLGAIIFNPPRNAKFTVDNVCVNTYEHGLLARFPNRILETAEQRALKDNDLDDELIATSKRAQIHALEQKQAGMSEHREKLIGQRKMIEELQREAAKPGYAHKTPTWMKEHLSAAWAEFKTILDVVHLQRDWDDEQRKRAETSLIHYLTQGSQRERVGHWQGMLQLANSYLFARTYLFHNRTKKTTELLERHNAEYAERFE